MSQIEDDYIAAGVQIVWILQETTGFQAASSEDTQNYYANSIRSEVGLRLGDADVLPVASVFENSPFIDTDRGFVMVVRLSDMHVVFEGTHGNGREFNGQTFLDEINALQ